MKTVVKMRNKMGKAQTNRQILSSLKVRKEKMENRKDLNTLLTKRVSYFRGRMNRLQIIMTAEKGMVIYQIFCSFSSSMSRLPYRKNGKKRMPAATALTPSWIRADFRESALAPEEGSKDASMAQVRLQRMAIRAETDRKTDRVLLTGQFRRLLINISLRKVFTSL